MWQITEIIKECCTCDPYKTPTFWVVHNLKKCPEHFSKYCNSQYIQACLRWPQECSLKNKEKKKSHWNYLISSKPLSKKSNIELPYWFYIMSVQYLDLNPRVKVKTLLLLYLLFGKQLHGKLGWFFPLDFTWEWPFFFI